MLARDRTDAKACHCNRGCPSTRPTAGYENESRVLPIIPIEWLAAHGLARLFAPRASVSNAYRGCNRVHGSGKPALVDAESIREPVDHEFLAERRIVMLAVVGTGFFL